MSSVFMAVNAFARVGTLLLCVYMDVALCVCAYFQRLSIQECSMALQKGILVLTAGPLSPLRFHLVSH